MDTKELTLQAGQYEMSIGNVLIPVQLLGDINVTYTEGTVEAATQAGTRRQGSGKIEEANVVFTVYLPSMDYLGLIYPDNYTQKTGTGDGGRVTFGGGACSVTKAVPVNIHPLCEETDKNDIHIYAGIPQKNVSPTLSTGDAVSVEITIDAQPTDDGAMTFGTLDPTRKTKWDVTQMKTVAVEIES